MKRRMASTLAQTALVLGLTASFGVAASADPGVFDDRIVVGQSAAFEGPARELGLGMRLGLEAAFSEVNENGGVQGRQLELVSRNDGYEPDAAIANVQELIDDVGIFALVGGVGTPTSVAAVPVAEQSGVPYVGQFSGAEFLRDPELGSVVNVRASYYQEAEAWIHHLTEDLGHERIAIFYQDDSYGRAGLSGVEAALERRGMELVGQGTYRRNTTAVRSALLDIQRSNPDAVVMVGAYEPCAQFIKLGRQIGLDATYMNISFVGSQALANELGPDGAGVIITQVVPFPWDTSVPIVSDYHAALAGFDAEASPGFVSLEGYIVGRFVIESLNAIDGEITRENWLEAIAHNGPFDLGGVTLAFGPDDNQGMDEVFFTVIEADGTFRALDDLREIG